MVFAAMISIVRDLPMRTSPGWHGKPRLAPPRVPGRQGRRTPALLRLIRRRNERNTKGTELATVFRRRR